MWVDTRPRTGEQAFLACEDALARAADLIGVTWLLVTARPCAASGGQQVEVWVAAQQSEHQREHPPGVATHRLIHD